MQSRLPVYPYSAQEARKRGEIEKWRESFRENCTCAGAIEIAIGENFDGMCLKGGTVERIVKQYGYKRMAYSLAMRGIHRRVVQRLPVYPRPVRRFLYSCISQKQSPLAEGRFHLRRTHYHEL